MRLCLKPLILSLLLLFTAVHVYGADIPESHFDFWQNNYQSLSPADDPRAARAQKIFERLLQAAGSKPGSIPRLLILKTSKYAQNGPAFALPDGGIIISKEVLDICYKVPDLGDDRLAFVLAHEIAHQYKDDFWHLKFFQALKLSSKNDTKDIKTLKEISEIAKSTDKVLAKEMQADEHGIIYAAMAGFNMAAIVKNDSCVNFFEDFYATLDPTKITDEIHDETHPTPKQRAYTVLARLTQVVENIEAFYLGINLYQAGKFKEAAKAFEWFAVLFPSREVYHNIASSYHQVALQAFNKLDSKVNAFPYKLTFSAATETRAADIILRGASTPENEFADTITKAIQYYEKAINHDPNFLISYINLGCAYLLNGEYYKAIAVLKDAEKLAPQDKGLQNNLGVAYYMVENVAKAKKTLEELYAAQKENLTALYNLGFIAYFEKDRTAAEQYFDKYLAVDKDTYWAFRVNKALGRKGNQKDSDMISDLPDETVDGIEPGSFEDEVPANWGKPLYSKIINSTEIPYLVNLYDNGIKTVSQDDEIVLIVLNEKYTDKTADGIKIGSSRNEVLKTYGNPSDNYNLSIGQTMIYQNIGISFHIQDEKIAGWLLFLN